MAMELVRGLKTRVPDADITFAVVGIPEEEQWGKRLGLKTTPRVNYLESLSTKLPRFVFLLFGKLTGNKAFSIEKYERLKRDAKLFTKSVQETDVIINMSGIAYVGDGALSRSHAINSYYPCHMAKKHKKPYAGFVQSYGPFQDRFVAWLAQKEFQAIPFIPARGKRCADHCRKITAPEKVYCFPDIAINLPAANPSWASDYLKGIGLLPESYIVLSPSSVMRNTVAKNEGSLGHKSVIAFRKILQNLLDAGEQIILLPHMYHTSRPERCDRVVCHEIIEGVEPTKRKSIHVIEDDLDPMQAKALITSSKLSLVSRYHALVAAISTATPVITLGWNDKYRDILDFYDLSEMAIDAANHSPDQVLEIFIEKKAQWLSDGAKLTTRMADLQSRNKASTDEAFNMLASWLTGTRPSKIMSEARSVDKVYFDMFSNTKRSIRNNNYQWRWIYESIKKHPHLETAADIGCGAGEYSLKLSNDYNIRVTAIDLFERAPTPIESETIHYVHGSADLIPLPDNSTDLALALSSIYYLNDPSKGLAEISRILRPGGIAVISGHTLYSIPTIVRRLQRLCVPNRVSHLNRVNFRDVDYYLDRLAEHELQLINLGGFFQPSRLNIHHKMARIPRQQESRSTMRYLMARHNYHFIFTVCKV